MDINELAQKELEEYEKKEKELKEQLVQLRKDKAITVKYLQAKGYIEVKKRGRRKKAAEPKA